MPNTMSCAHPPFLQVQDGIVSAERFVLDSIDTKFNMHGEVNLKQDSISYQGAPKCQCASSNLAVSPATPEFSYA